MNRRHFLRLSSMAAPALGIGMRSIASASSAISKAGTTASRWRTYEVTTTVKVLSPFGTTRVWLPQPLAGETAFQRTLSNSVICDLGEASWHEDQGTGLKMLAARFPAGIQPVIKTVQRVATRDWSVDLSRARKTAAPHQHSVPADAARFLRPTDYVPTDGIVKARADEITTNAHTDVEKAQAIYDWIVTNTYRDSEVRGCGVGDIRPMLQTGNFGGKCADINALFVGLAKASGVPARDVYGLRVGPSALQCSSLGTSSGAVSKTQHCRAEVYLTEFGWVPMDPADVRKVILEEPPSHLPFSDIKVEMTRERLFGSWEMNWIAYNYAQDVTLPGSSGPKLHFFMYPQAETEEGRLDCLDPDSFHYEIAARELNG